MSRSAVFEQTVREAGGSKPARVSGLEEKQSNVQMSKEQSIPLHALKYTLSKHYERNRRYYRLKRFSFHDLDLTRVLREMV